MIVIFNKQNTVNKPVIVNGAGSNRKTEAKNKSKGKGARYCSWPRDI